MHVAAINPQYLSADDVPAEQVAKEREIFVAQVGRRPEGGGQARRDRREDGRGQGPQVPRRDHAARPAVRQGRQAVAVGDVLKKAKASVVRFVRYEVGAGIEKKQENFAAEVMATGAGRLKPPSLRSTYRNPARAGFLIMTPVARLARPDGSSQRRQRTTIAASSSSCPVRP